MQYNVKLRRVSFQAFLQPHSIPECDHTLRYLFLLYWITIQYILLY